MVRIFAFLVLAILCGCCSPRTEQTSAVRLDWSEWENLAHEIQDAASDDSQAAALLRFHQLFARVSAVEPMHGYHMMYFNAEGRMLLPDDHPYQDASFAVFYDFVNRPTLFFPFLVQLRGTHARQMLMLPR